MDVQETVGSSEGSQTANWQMFGQKVPKSEIVFFVQVILVYIVAITSIINLTLNNNSENGKLWTALLSSSIGYILPNPSFKKK